MNLYETVIINTTATDDSKYQAFITRIDETVKAHSGKILINDKWGARKMAYTIDKEKNGHYTYLAYTGDNVLVAEIERQLRNLDYIIRYLTVKVGDTEEVNEAEFLTYYQTGDFKTKSNLNEFTFNKGFSRGNFRGGPRGGGGRDNYREKDMDSSYEEQPVDKE